MNELRTYISLSNDLRSGKITPRAYLEECLDRIAKDEPRIRAFVMLNLDGARKTADAASELAIGTRRPERMRRSFSNTTRRDRQRDSA